MLRNLHVRNYVLIAALDIEFPNGLVIVTGQTGAGKSIIMGALSMLSGAKADISAIGDSSDNCVIEAEFEVDSGDEVLKQLIEENGAEWDDGRLTVRRVIGKSGRSRAFVNDSPVSLSSLSSISSRLIDIHSQHQTLLLSDKKFQLRILDSYAENSALLAEYSEAWSRHNKLVSQIEALTLRIAQADMQKDYVEAQFRQLEEAKIREGELEELEDEQRRLANAEDIKLHLCNAESMISGGGYDSESVKSVTAVLKDVQKEIEKVACFIPEFSSLAERAESARLDIEDIGSEIAAISERTEVSSERLQAVDDRISLLYSLMHKHSCSTLSDLIAYKVSLAESIVDSAALKEEVSDLSAELSSVSASLDRISAQLHESRTLAASGFAKAIQQKLHFLELPYAVFTVDIVPVALGPDGADSIVFEFSASGSKPVDVAKCASGGEMSRIMLSLKALMSRFFKMPTMVFDEIDTGVSGSVADKMGTMICDMGKYMQVFAITHLPQVAAKGDAHYLVSKNIDPVTSKAITTIKKLSDQQRVMEVARMLSGSVLSEAAIANAKDLLQAR